MIDYFDPNQFKGSSSNPLRCGGCKKRPQRCTVTRALRAEFTGMTGIDWVPGQLMGINLQKDYRSLGLDPDGVPLMVFFCLPCVVDYMKTFNDRLKQVSK